MPFQKVTPERLSQSVVQQFEVLILRGILRPGERLPSERALSEMLDVSRPSLRAAIAELQAAGLLVTRPNSGLFVAEVLGATFTPALAGLFARHPEASRDFIAFRRDVEGLAAERAARLATDTDLRVIEAVLDRMQAGHQRQDAEEEAQLDALFHLSIVEASHNIVMLHMMRSIYDLLRQGVFFNRQVMFAQRITRGGLLAQHAAILAAIRTRDPARARSAVEAHIDYIARALAEQQRADHNEKVAQLRFEHEKSR